MSSSHSWRSQKSLDVLQKAYSVADCRWCKNPRPHRVVKMMDSAKGECKLGSDAVTTSERKGIVTGVPLWKASSEAGRRVET